MKTNLIRILLNTSILCLLVEGYERRVEISFCLKESCIKTGVKRYNTQEIKPFEGVIWVDAKDAPLMPVLDTIEFRKKITTD
jgi:hypothetical protein